jgi:hypothetical protein
MKEHAFLFFALVLPACSGSSGGDSPATGDAGTHSDTANADVGTSFDGGEDTSPAPDGPTETSADGGKEDAGAGDTADTGDAGDAPKPPPGATKCGFGTITQADAFKACGDPSMTLDYKSDFDGGFTKVPRHCDAVTIDSGRWEVWCSPTALYIWAEWDGVRSTGSWSAGCPGDETLAIGMGLWDYGWGSGGGGGSLPPYKVTPAYGFSKSTPAKVTLELSYTGAVPSGAAHLFVSAYHWATCGGGKVGPRDEDAVVTAMPLAWPTK